MPCASGSLHHSTASPKPALNHLHQTCITCIKPASPASNLHHLHHTCITCIKPASPSSHLNHLHHTCITPRDPGCVPPNTIDKSLHSALSSLRQPAVGVACSCNAMWCGNARLELSQETQSASELGGIAVGVGEYYIRSDVALSCMCALGGALSCVSSWMSTRT